RFTMLHHMLQIQLPQLLVYGRGNILNRRRIKSLVNITHSGKLLHTSPSNKTTIFEPDHWLRS
ncbi:MAG: hypothetical protein WBH50_17785, partial [Fuerstiella sp.]